jgi:hypothetical protein
MANLSQRQVLAARYEGMQAAGLVDVKFFLRNAGEATSEQVCGEVNAMYDALALGNYKPLDFGDKTIK